MTTTVSCWKKSGIGERYSAADIGATESVTNSTQWNGPKQYQDKTSKSLMMLPTDMALVKDKEFLKHVERYAKDNEVFFAEFRDVIVKLLELGVPFQSKEEDRITLQPTS